MVCGNNGVPGVPVLRAVDLAKKAGKGHVRHRETVVYRAKEMVMKILFATHHLAQLTVSLAHGPLGVAALNPAGLVSKHENALA